VFCYEFHQGWWWRQYAPLKRRSTFILHGSITQKTTLNMIKICSRIFFRGEAKPSSPCCKILQHVKDPYSMIEIRVDNIHGHLLLPGVSASYCQRVLIGESEMIRTQMEKHNRSVMGRLAQYNPVNSNSSSTPTVLTEVFSLFYILTVSPFMILPQSVIGF
jgi:hypothetical protein